MKERMRDDNHTVRRWGGEALEEYLEEAPPKKVTGSVRGMLWCSPGGWEIKRAGKKKNTTQGVTG